MKSKQIPTVKSVSGLSNRKLKQRYKEYVARAVKRLQPKREMPMWEWASKDAGGVVSAWTRSEAKARIKQRLGVKKLKGVTIAPQA